MHRRFFVIIVVLAALYSGYWAVGRAALVRALDQAEAQIAPALTYDTRRTIGYPSRFDTSWSAPRLRLGAITLAAPALQVFALSYRPDGAIAFLPAPLELWVGGHALRLDSADLRGSLRVVPGQSLTLRRGTFVGEALALSDAGRPLGTLARAMVALRQAEGNAADLWIEADDLRIAGTPAFTRVEIDARAALSAPLALRAPPPTLSAIDLRRAQIRLGDADLTLSGQLDVGRAGRLNGTLRLTGHDWQVVLERAVRVGLLEAQVAETWRELGLRAGDAEELDIALPVRGGRVFLGLFPIAVLPQLYRQ